jgi:hypothetical protein
VLRRACVGRGREVGDDRVWMRINFVLAACVWTHGGSGTVSKPRQCSTARPTMLLASDDHLGRACVARTTMIWGRSQYVLMQSYLTVVLDTRVNYRLRLVTKHHVRTDH